LAAQLSLMEGKEYCQYRRLCPNVSQRF